MTDPDLTRLKYTPIPPSRDAAKRAALAAAIEAFDKVAFDDAAKKSASETQGSAEPIRLKDASSRTEGKKTMRASQFNYTLAASIAALMIAAPAAFMLSRQMQWSTRPMTAPETVGQMTDAATSTRDTIALSGKLGGGTRSNAIATAPAAMHESAAPAKQNGLGGSVELSAREAARKIAKAAEPVAAIKSKQESLRLASRDRDSARSQAMIAGGNLDTPQMEAGANMGVEPQPSSPAPSMTLSRPTSAMPGQTDNARLTPSRNHHSVENKAVDERGFIAGAHPSQSQMAPGIAFPQDYFDAAEKEFRDKFDAKDINPVKQVAQEPVSTFSIDVDTASYAFARRMINAGQLPPKDSVRVEEMINYFPYNYPKPDSADAPFKPTITVVPSPWNAGNRLVHVAVQGYTLQGAQRPRANLVFLVDVSGSMAPDDRLPLVKNALRMLVDELQPQDSVSLVTYASGSGVALEPTPVSKKHKIIAAIDALGAGGSTAGAQGIQDAYRLAETHFDKSGVNRVILATDGDFNVGVTDQGELKGLIERKREKGIFLSILGVGQGNYNDSLMQILAQNGNGTAAYVDNLNEARKVLVEEASSTIFPIAKDVKIQVEWNPARVSEYRLIGYETRALKREDFNNDRVDAGDVGSGHRVTAIYEITPTGSDRKLVDDLRYNPKPAEMRATPAAGSPEGELGFFKLRYKLPKEDKSKLISQPIGEAQSVESLAKAPEDVRFSVAVAAFGQLLKGAPYLHGFGYDNVVELAQGARGDDRFGYRTEFVNLARLAKSARP